VTTLDGYLRQREPGHASRRCFLKIDTQGFEDQVLEGASATLQQTDVILMEMSLVPLYLGARDFTELYRATLDRGYRCVSLTPGFFDNQAHEMLQIDGLFVRA
jgi:hypothetical protein